MYTYICAEAFFFLGGGGGGGGAPLYISAPPAAGVPQRHCCALQDLRVLYRPSSCTESRLILYRLLLSSSNLFTECYLKR